MGLLRLVELLHLLLVSTVVVQDGVGVLVLRQGLSLRLTSKLVMVQNIDIVLLVTHFPLLQVLPAQLLLQRFIVLTHLSLPLSGHFLESSTVILSALGCAHGCLRLRVNLLLIGLIRLSRVLGLELLSRGVALDAVLHDLESLNWLLLLLDELMLTTCDAFCFLV